MLPLKKILFPVDFSEQSRGAARYVEAFTGRFKAALTLLSASDPHYNDILPDDISERRRRLETFFGKDFEYFPVEYALAEGEPATNIVTLANTGHVFDLINDAHARSGRFPAFSARLGDGQGSARRRLSGVDRRAPRTGARHRKNRLQEFSVRREYAALQ